MTKQTKRAGRTRAKKKSSAPAQKLIKSYQEGNSSIKIAKAFGITDYDVLSILRSNGVRMRTSQEARSKPRKGESFAELYPHLKKLWDQDQNSPVTPKDVKSGSQKKFWWRCDKNKNHTWYQAVHVITSGHRCPICSGNKLSSATSLAAKYAELCKFFDLERNKTTPDKLMPNSTLKVWWRGQCGHNWESSPNRMVTAFKRSKTQSGCPYCGGKQVWPGQSFADLNPDRAQFWHPTKNGELKPEQVSPNSEKKIWWMCTKYPTHIWNTTVTSWTRSIDCPFCQNRRLDPKTNSLKVTNPKLARQWHPTKNGSLKPTNVTSGYSKPVWWHCKKGPDHIWKQSPIVRTKADVGCPFCGGIRLSVTNSLAAKNPRITKQWIRSQNLPLRPEKVRQNDKRYVWWQCPIDRRHKYRARIAQRFQGAQCPFCTLAPRSKTEIYLDFELRQFFSISPEQHVVRVGEINHRCDIVLERDKVIIEFDGSYWHKDLKDKDIEKAQILTASGWKVIRVREEPLTATSLLDVVVPQQSIKLTADAVINRLLKLGVKTHNDPKSYLHSKSATNKAAADAYIRKRLKRRADRRLREVKRTNVR